MEKEFLKAYLSEEAIPDTITSYQSLPDFLKFVTDEATRSARGTLLKDIFDNAKAKFQEEYGKGYYVTLRRCMLWNDRTVPLYVPYNQWKPQELDFDIPLLVFGNIGYGLERRYTHFARTIFLGNLGDRLKDQYADMVKDHNETLMEHVILGKTLSQIYNGYKNEVKKIYEEREKQVPKVHRVLSGIGAKANVKVWEVRDGGYRSAVMLPRHTFSTNLVYEYTDVTSGLPCFLAHGDTVVTYSNKPAQLFSSYISEETVLDESKYEDLESTIVIDPEDGDADELLQVAEEPEEDGNDQSGGAEPRGDVETQGQIADRCDTQARATGVSNLCYGSNRPNRNLGARVVAIARKAADLEQAKQQDLKSQRYGVWK